MCDINSSFLCKPDASDIIGFFIVLSVYIIVTPITLCGLIFLTTKYRTHGFIRHREWNLTFVFILFLIMEMLIDRPYLECYGIWYCFGDSPPPTWTGTFAYSVFFWTIYALHALRIWKLYYVQRVNQCIADHCWTSSINGVTGNIKSNWFINNRNKWGNTKWYVNLCRLQPDPFSHHMYIYYRLMRIFIPFTMVTALSGPLIVAIFENEEWPHYLNLIWMMIPVIIGITLLIKAKHIVDIYGIKRELLYSTVIIIITVIVYYGSFLIYIFGGFGDPSSPEVTRWAWRGYTISGYFNITCLAMITTFFPFYYHRKMKCGNNSTYSQIPKMGMMNVLKSPLGFRMFMKYLVTGKVIKYRPQCLVYLCFDSSTKVAYV